PYPANYTPGPGVHVGPLGTTWFWDGVKWAILRPRVTNSAGPSSPTPVCKPSVMYNAGHSEIVVFGGRRDWCRTSGETWIWNGSEWIPPTLGQTGPDMRTGSSTAYDASRNVDVLFGGYDGGGCQIANLP